ncbi:2-HYDROXYISOFLAVANONE DEHYDRATASE-LIKE [Salix viminalis]|uniref:2-HYDROXYISOFLAVANONE DEHYDRATASE-LIKE n=1 Tax=Salix viminalis TaxID=40686 RepID=A0A9Q0QJG1_SALVM|nr:2-HYDROXYISOFLAVANONE DEHYDRATASE-LIKE [Salix viminalis]
MAPSAVNEVVHEFPFFKVYKDSRVELVWPECPKTPPSTDLVTGVQSKDVIISKEPQVSVRMFLPELKTPNQKLPLLLFVHGGGFVMFSSSAIPYHVLCSKVAADAGVIVVSVEYGLFPARPIPACYEDSWEALQWVASHADGSGSEPWLSNHADFGKVFLGGDSGGGNISHTLAFRVGSIGNSGLDDPRLNPGLEDLARLGCGRVLIFVAEKDDLRVVGKNYYEKLKKSGWKGSVEIVENENQVHCFYLHNLNSEKAAELIHRFVSFLKQD